MQIKPTNSLTKLLHRNVHGWNPKRPGGKKHRYYCLPPLESATLTRTIYIWSATREYLIVDYHIGMPITEVRKILRDYLELNWPTARLRVTTLRIPDDAVLHHSPPRGYSVALHGTIPRQLVFCE